MPGQHSSSATCDHYLSRVDGCAEVDQGRDGLRGGRVLEKITMKITHENDMKTTSQVLIT